MGVKKKQLQTYKKFSAPISYQLLDDGKLYDAKNVFDNKGVTETRYGLSRWNTTSLGGEVLSVSFFKDNAGNSYLIAKVGSVIYKVNASGAATALKSGLGATSKHRGKTVGKGRHIIAVEGEVLLYSYNGTTFTQLGQVKPAAIATVAAGTGALTNSVYQVAYTYFASTIGFETNKSPFSANVTTSGQGIDVSAMATTAANALIDKKRIYLKNVTADSDWIFVAEIALGTSTYTIAADPQSTNIAPKDSGVPPGGAKYVTDFGDAVAVAGNVTYPSDVFISKNNVPDAFSDLTDARIINVQGNGPITGIACGLFGNSLLFPFLACFKKSSITIHEANTGTTTQTSTTIGCISHDTISVQNGVVYFMAENGFYRIIDGILEKDEKGEPKPLAGYDITDIFSKTGWVYELNKAQFENFFSVYYATLGHYLTFIAEGSNSAISKAYNYEKALGGFRAYSFESNTFKCGCAGEDASGNVVIFLGDDTGTIFTHSVREDRHDVNENDTSSAIDAFLIAPWIYSDDMYSSHNFKELLLTAIASDNAVTVKGFLNFSMQSFVSGDFSFADPQSGFVLDISVLDQGTFGDDRAIVTQVARIDRTARSFMLGIYQNIADANMSLISGQLAYNKNGNRNI